jgi:hypothetical protein
LTLNTREREDHKIEKYKSMEAGSTVWWWWLDENKYTYINKIYITSVVEGFPNE